MIKLTRRPAAHAIFGSSLSSLYSDGMGMQVMGSSAQVGHLSPRQFCISPLYLFLSKGKFLGMLTSTKSIR